MKRIITLFMCAILLFSFSGCSYLFDYQNDAIDNFDIGYSRVLNEAFVSSYNWDGTDAARSIVIPEEYNGVNITALGGYYGTGVPCAFGVDLPETYTNKLSDEVNEWISSDIYDDVGSVDTIYLNFDLHISKNIEQITKHTLDCIYEGVYFDGEEYQLKIIVVLLYNITCDEDNKIFYAKDGKLYYRENDELVSDILYLDHEFIN